MAGMCMFCVAEREMQLELHDIGLVKSNVNIMDIEFAHLK